MDFIGLALGALTMIPFLDPHGQDPKIPEKTTNVRIGAGIGASGNSNPEMMGSQPGVALFDGGGNKIGQSDVDDKDMDAWVDIPIRTDNGPNGGKDTLPTYISISAGKDAICIAYITVTSSSGLKYAWVGDIAQACQVPYYYTPVQFAELSNGYTPACMWLNGLPNENGAIYMKYDEKPLQFRGMGLRFTDFSTPANAQKSDQYIAYNQDFNLFCRSQPRFWLYDQLTPDDYIPYFVGNLQFNENGTDADPAKILDSKYWATATPPPETFTPEPLPVANYKRSSKKHLKEQHVNRGNSTAMRLRSSYINANIMTDHLVTSNASIHSASKLCADPASAGPDFVSHDEQMYCDMANKKVYPLCVGKEQSCFDLDLTVLRPEPLETRDSSVKVKNYTKVIDW